LRVRVRQNSNGVFFNDEDMAPLARDPDLSRVVATAIRDFLNKFGTPQPL
jgi:hypothetical protein